MPLNSLAGSQGEAHAVEPRSINSSCQHPRLTLWLLRAAAVFALGWSVFRALRQSVTLDEADTYLWFGGGQEARFIWYPFPNNHVLNSMLIWISTHLFGVSDFSIRIPALVGAALYISIAYFLCRALTGRFALQLAAFVCLVYNPFILDFFAAARGYTLANAFLLAALAIPVYHSRTGRKPIAASTAWASAAIGLSFVANFAFALVDGAALLAIMIWTLRRRGTDSILRILGSAILPVLAVPFGLCGYTIVHYSREHLWYGARSLSEMTQSLVDACLYQLPPWLGYSDAVRSTGRYLLIVLAALCVCRFLLGLLDRRSRHDTRTTLAAGVAGVIATTVAAHYLAFRITKLPLPMSRTAIFFLPLCMLFVLLVAALPANSRLLRLLSYSATGLILMLAAHFLLCMRYTYFKEYAQAAEMKEVYRVLQQLNQRYGVQDFTVSGEYTSPLNFYRVAEKAVGLSQFQSIGPVPPIGKPVYVIHGSYYGPFLKEHHMVVLYRGPVSRVVVAVPPDGLVPPQPVTP